MGRRKLEDLSITSLYDSSGKKPMSKTKSGKLTRNPFFAFLRDMRRRSQGMDITEVAIRGAELWSRMDRSQRRPYCELARKVARRRRRGRRRRRRRRRGRRRRRSHGSDSPPSRSRSRTRSRSRSASHGSKVSEWSAPHDFD